MNVAENPLTDAQMDFVRIRSRLQTCPECGRDVDVIDLTASEDIYVHHEGDDVPGLAPNPQHVVARADALDAIG